MKTILITGSTDGIGLATVKMLLPLGHTILIHGRTEAKVQATLQALNAQNSPSTLYGYTADLSDMDNVRRLAEEVKENHETLDILINNAGVFMVPEAKTKDNLDLRFVVNTIAPYLLTNLLLPMMNNQGRVINLSSAAQAPVSFAQLTNYTPMRDGDAYAQSKLALTMWTFEIARQTKTALIAVNPKSFLGSNMVKEAYGVAGHDLSIGASILHRLALSDAFEGKTGFYYDNDSGRIANPHPQAMDQTWTAQLVEVLDHMLETM